VDGLPPLCSWNRVSGCVRGSGGVVSCDLLGFLYEGQSAEMDRGGQAVAGLPMATVWAFAAGGAGGFAGHGGDLVHGRALGRRRLVEEPVG
jgi:hypothetical protein